jgi:hypothetical protein
MTRRGALFHCATATGGVSIASLTLTTTAPFAMYNPKGSNIDIVLLEVGCSVWGADLVDLLRRLRAHAPRAAIAFVMWADQRMFHSKLVDAESSAAKRIREAAKQEHALGLRLLGSCCAAGRGWVPQRTPPSPLSSVEGLEPSDEVPTHVFWSL